MTLTPRWLTLLHCFADPPLGLMALPPLKTDDITAPLAALTFGQPSVVTSLDRYAVTKMTVPGCLNTKLWSTANTSLPELPFSGLGMGKYATPPPVA